MDHVAIMNKSWNLIPKILSGDKRIESRWYKAKFPPWNKISINDKVYFKNSGGLVIAEAEVEEIMQFENYTEVQLEKIIDKYHGIGGINFVSSKEDIFNWAKQRKHCILIFLKNPKKVTPFQINKSGFGNACAWICVDDISKIKL